MAKARPIPCIHVLAGINGSGKSSIMGAMLLQAGAHYYNPDEAARLIQSANPGISQAEANSLAWGEGKRLLQRAIKERCDFVFETTLGGKTITGLLGSALDAGMEVHIWYAGLSSPELAIARVRSRVARGGHPIPDATIRERYPRSLLNLIQLMPRLTELLVYDNSEEADPHAGMAPEPELILHLVRSKIVRSCDLTISPEWAKPILVTAMKLASEK